MCNFALFNKLQKTAYLKLNSYNQFKYLSVYFKFFGLWYYQFKINYINEAFTKLKS